MPVEKEQQKKNIINAGITGSSAETIKRYGSAVKEHIVAYTGNDNETGTQYKRSLKSIAKQKVNPGYKEQNIKQQAGFSAEVKETANVNANNIINGSAKRKVRTDDLGRVNDPFYDHVEIDARGNIVDGSGTQMKFVGNTPQETLNKLVLKKFSKYLDKDCKIEVPSDYFDGLLQEIDSRIAKFQVQEDNQLVKGNTETASRLKQKIKKYQKIRKNLRKSSVSSSDSRIARLHPVVSTAEGIVNVSHGAGLEAAQSAGIIGGSVSIIQNLVAVVKGEAGVEDAVKSVAKDTLTSISVGYGTGFTGAAVKGIMQNSSSETLRSLSETNLPGVVVTVAMCATKSLNRYFRNEITGVECFTELGEQGTGMLSSALFAVIGQAVIPIPVIGGMIGSMIGYATASASYQTLLNSLRSAEYAHEERIKIEKVCEEHIKLIRTYRLEFEKTISEYLTSKIKIFHNAFNNIKVSLDLEDVDGFILSTNEISEILGRKAQFQNMSEFTAIMSSNNSFKI
ncbi:MAG: hypothetical protein ABF868_04930 [Sporolactobacillus sp.]